MNTVSAEKNNTAYLSCSGEYSSFTFRDKTVSFLTGHNLLTYTDIKLWDNGYLVVMCLNRDGSEEEDYIDLLPILDNLYMDKDEFLAPISEVKIRNVR